MWECVEQGGQGLGGEGIEVHGVCTRGDVPWASSAKYPRTAYACILGPRGADPGTIRSSAQLRFGRPIVHPGYVLLVPKESIHLVIVIYGHRIDIDSNEKGMREVTIASALELYCLSNRLMG